MSTTTEWRLEGAPNFRDIGGAIGADGRRIKREHIFRSGELSKLSDADIDLLRRLGIGCVADLRSAAETKVMASRWPAADKVELHRADITLDLRVEGRPVIELIVEDPTPAAIERVVCRGFPVIADQCGPALRHITQRLAHRDDAILFHCTNGRDRTGVISAMLLYMLGADREAIVADFMLTNARIDVERVIVNTIDTYRKALGMELTREAIEPVTLVRASYMAAMFQGMADRYGSAEGYLDHFGIDAGLRAALRERLLEAD